MLESVQDTKALGSMIIARIVYALNWLNVGAIFVLMASDVGAGVSGLGIVSAAFYLGIGIFQIPGGLLAAKWGPKKVVVLGIFMFSFSVLGTAVSATIPELAVLRFIVGAGMAFVFAPGIVIITRLLRGGKSGMGVGLFNSAYDLGGLLALSGWIAVAMVTGWRLSLVTSGGLGIITGILTFLFVPGDEVRAEFRISMRPLLDVLKNKQLILIGLGTIGFDVGNTIISSFMIYYLVSIKAASGTVAGLVASLVTVVPIFAALWFGRAYDVIVKHRMIMTLAILGSAGSLVFGAFPSILAAILCSAIGGLVAGVGYTFAFAGARDLNRAGKEYEGLAISWVNSIHLTGSFLPPIFFSYIVESLGYSQAWLWSAALTLVFLVPILLMVERWGTRAASL